MSSTPFDSWCPTNHGREFHFPLEIQTFLTNEEEQGGERTFQIFRDEIMTTNEIKLV